MALHRRAEAWMAARDIFQARGKPHVARWCLKRGAVWERRAVEAVRREHPERERTIAILEGSAQAMEEKARRSYTGFCAVCGATLAPRRRRYCPLHAPDANVHLRRVHKASSRTYIRELRLELGIPDRGN